MSLSKSLQMAFLASALQAPLSACEPETLPPDDCPEIEIRKSWTGIRQNLSNDHTDCKRVYHSPNSPQGLQRSITLKAKKPEKIFERDSYGLKNFPFGRVGVQFAEKVNEIDDPSAQLDHFLDDRRAILADLASRYGSWDNLNGIEVRTSIEETSNLPSMERVLKGQSNGRLRFAESLVCFRKMQTGLTAPIDSVSWKRTAVYSPRGGCSPPSLKVDNTISVYRSNVSIVRASTPTDALNRTYPVAIPERGTVDGDGLIRWLDAPVGPIHNQICEDLFILADAD